MAKPIGPEDEWFLAYILGYFQDNGCSPTLMEMTDAWNARHKSNKTKDAVDYRVRRLIAAGRIKRTKRCKWRNLAPISA